MFIDRVELYKKLEKEFDTKIITYITSDRPGFETQIAQDTIDLFIGQLDKMGVVDKISLFLYTQGGDTAAAWNIVNLLKMYCDTLEVIIPRKAHSAGTIISLGANNIIMTKQATLGPIDPSLNTPLNPKILTNRGETSYPVSVEAVKGYIEFAKEEAKICDDEELTKVLLKLTDYVHPLVLGQVYRTRSQIKMLAEKLLKNQINNQEDLRRIISFLCSDSGSHDYTINRREAKDELKLNIIKPSEEQYHIIKAIYDDISEELGFKEVFDIRRIQGAFVVKRALLESVEGGSDYFVTEGRCFVSQTVDGQNICQSEVVFEGWRSEGDINMSGEIVRESSAIGQEETEVEYERTSDDGL